MLCGLCQRDLTASVTGGLMKYTCPACNVHYLESLSETTDPNDLWNIIQQVTRKDGDNGTGQPQ